jgi:hypothetical protein
MSRYVEYRETPLLGTPKPPKPVSLPPIRLPAIDLEADAAEAAERAAVTKTIRQGRDAWEHISDANSFSAWCRIGAALAIGKGRALSTTGANAAWGATYSRAFNKWMAEYGFGAMRPSDRSHAIALHENLQAVERWRTTLSDKERRRLRTAQANVKKWTRQTATRTAPPDSVAKALAAWCHFRTCMQALTNSQSGEIWQAVAAEAAAHA